MTFSARTHKAVILSAAVLGLFLTFFVGVAYGDETPLGVGADLSEPEFQAMLGRPSDEQVRDILVSEFEARRIAAPVPDIGLMETLRGLG